MSANIHAPDGIPIDAHNRICDCTATLQDFIAVIEAATENAPSIDDPEYGEYVSRIGFQYFDVCGNRRRIKNDTGRPRS